MNAIVFVYLFGSLKSQAQVKFPCALLIAHNALNRFPLIKKDFFFKFIFVVSKEWCREDFNTYVLVSGFFNMKRNFISPGSCVIFLLLYKCQWNTKSFHKEQFYMLHSNSGLSCVQVTCYLHEWRCDVLCAGLLGTSLLFIYWKEILNLKSLFCFILHNRLSETFVMI